MRCFRHSYYIYGDSERLQSLFPLCLCKTYDSLCIGRVFQSGLCYANQIDTIGVQSCLSRHDR